MAAEAPSSSSSRSNVYHHGSSDVDKALTEPELVAAQQLMQLSDNSGSSCGSKKRRSYKGEEDEYETDEEGVVEYQSPLSVITCAKIEEIFGKEEDFRPKKKRTTKYRSLADIYSRTNRSEDECSVPASSSSYGDGRMR